MSITRNGRSTNGSSNGNSNGTRTIQQLCFNGYKAGFKSRDLAKVIGGGVSAQQVAGYIAAQVRSASSR
jgi:hypothetical protein